MRYLRSLLYKLNSLVTRWFSPYGICELISTETIGRLEATDIADHRIVIYCEKQVFNDLRWDAESGLGRRIIYRLYSVCNPCTNTDVKHACRLEVFYPLPEGLIGNSVSMMDVLAGNYLELLRSKIANT